MGVLSTRPWGLPHHLGWYINGQHFPYKMYCQWHHYIKEVQLYDMSWSESCWSCEPLVPRPWTAQPPDLVDQFIYHSSNISSTGRDAYICIGRSYPSTELQLAYSTATAGREDYIELLYVQNINSVYLYNINALKLIFTTKTWSIDFDIEMY